MSDYEYDFRCSINTAKSHKCVCLNCPEPNTLVILNGEPQGYVIFAAEGDIDGILVQWKPSEDGERRWLISKGRVEIKHP